MVRVDAGHADAAWFRGAYADYLRGLSNYAPSAYTLDALGVWQPDHVPFWLSDPSAHALVAYAEGRPVGFACVGGPGFPYKEAESDSCLAELYVRPESRSRGFGAELASHVLRMFPGRWELSVLEANLPALRFWRRLLPGVAVSTREIPEPGRLGFRFEVVDGAR